MNRRHALKTLAGLALCPLCASDSFAAEGPHWTYGGRNGPESWGKLAPANRVCSIGAQQSPLDIVGALKSELPPLNVAWAKTADTIVNNGHTIQVNAGSDAGTLRVGDANYRLVQFHFHHPSEHLIGGKRYPMEVHFVHATADNHLGVLGAIMVAGKANSTFAAVASTMPPREGKPAKADAAIDPNGLLPAGRNYWSYAGSLTTPPCAETVTWMLLTEPLEVADADIAKFGKLFAMNARPPQKLNRRFVLRSG